MSFGSLSGNADRGAEPGRRARRLPAQHRRGRPVAATTATAASWSSSSAPPTSAAATTQGRFDLDRLADAGRGRPGAGDGDQALPGRQARPRRPAAGGEGHRARSPPPAASPAGEDCVSPSRHAAFSDVDCLLDLVELLAAATGLPVGIKSAVGDLGFWDELADADGATTGRGVDFVTVDGGEGGTGAAPLLFTDPVALPVPARLRPRLPAVRRGAACTETWPSSAPASSASPTTRWSRSRSAPTWSTSGREAMLAIGCIQAQRATPTAARPAWPPRTRWLHPRPGPGPQVGAGRPTTSARCAGTWPRSPRRSACEHPGLITPEDIDLLDGDRRRTGLGALYGYGPGGGRLGEERSREVREVMAALAP